MPLPPVVNINWSLSQSNVGAPFGWNVSNSGSTIRFDVQDSANCGGPNGSIQSGDASANLFAQARFNMNVSLTGLGETQDVGFENMTLRFNGTNIISATSPGGQQGCAFGGPVIQTVLVPGPYFLAKNTNNSFALSFTTADPLFHIGCFYQCNLSFTLLDPPEIIYFFASPNPQTSGTFGIPSNTTELYWSTFGAELLSINQGVGDLSLATSSSIINTGLQSIQGITSPATKTYTITASNTAGTVTSQVTVEVTNDNTPNSVIIPNQNNVEPNTVITIIVGPITGIDMITGVTGGTGVTVSNNNINFSSFITIQNNQTFYIRVTSLPFNTDPNGLTNSSTYSVTVGTVQRFFTVTTRAPDVNETFDFANQDDYVPFPDIDTIPDPDPNVTNQSNQYLFSNTLLVDDIELANPNGVEIKVDKPDAQIRVKRFGESTFGSWQNVRGI